jgi:hypothetical protein
MKAKPILTTALLLLVSAGVGCGTLFNAKRKTVTFASEPAGADILVNGNRVGSTPYQMELEQGKPYTITFRKAGHHDVTCMIGGAPRFLDSVDRQFLCSSLRVQTAQIDERGSVPEG